MQVLCSRTLAEGTCGILLSAPPPAPHLLGSQCIQLSLQPGPQSPLHLLSLFTRRLQLGKGLLQLLNFLDIGLLLS